MLYCFKDYEPTIELSNAAIRKLFLIINIQLGGYEMDKVTINFQYTKNEYIFAFRRYLLQSKIIKKLDLVIVSVLAVFEVFLLIWNGFSLYSLVLGMIVIFYTLMFALLYLLQPANVYNRTPKLHQQYKLSFTTENINYKTADVSSILNWDIYSEIWNCNDFFYLIQAKNIYTIIPKRVFKNVNDLKTFEKIILSNNKITFTNYMKEKK